VRRRSAASVMHGVIMGLLRSVDETTLLRFYQQTFPVR